MRYLTGLAALVPVLLGFAELAQQPAIRPAASTPSAPPAPWNLRKGSRGWVARLRGLLITFAALVMLWIAAVFHLFNFSPSY